MSWLGELVGGAGSVLTGGITGLIGTTVSGFIEHKKQKQIANHELKREEMALKIMEKEWEGKYKVTDREAENIKEIAVIDAAARMSDSDAKVLIESYKSDARKYTKGLALGNFGKSMMSVVDFIRGTLRPIVTYCFIIYSFIMFRNFVNMSTLEILGDEAIRGYIAAYVDATIYLTVTCVTWWFGDRRRTRNASGREVK